MNRKVLTILKACGFKGKAPKGFAKKEKGNPIFRIAFLRDCFYKFGVFKRLLLFELVSLFFFFACDCIHEYCNSTVACYVTSCSEAVLCDVKSNHKCKHRLVEAKH